MAIRVLKTTFTASHEDIDRLFGCNRPSATVWNTMLQLSKKFATANDGKRIPKGELYASLKNQFDKNGKTAKAVIGISGGKDSSIVASLCVEALGIERVIGVLMPNVMQDDINDALELVHWLRLDCKIVNIGTAYHAILSQLISGRGIYIDTDSSRLQQNLPPRLRMATLYAIAQGIPEGGRVVNYSHLPNG